MNESEFYLERCVIVVASEYGGIRLLSTLDFRSDHLIGCRVTCNFPESDPVWSSSWAQGLVSQMPHVLCRVLYTGMLTPNDTIQKLMEILWITFSAVFYLPVEKRSPVVESWRSLILLNKVKLISSSFIL
ncbi:hypothetical protein Tco_0475523 [Tanacetum coccineum]